VDIMASYMCPEAKKMYSTIVIKVGKTGLRVALERTE
jgi:hypothetical protein